MFWFYHIKSLYNCHKQRIWCCVLCNFRCFFLIVTHCYRCKTHLHNFLNFKATCRLLGATLIEISDQSETDVVTKFQKGMLYSRIIVFGINLVVSGKYPFTVMYFESLVLFQLWRVELEGYVLKSKRHRYHEYREIL